MIYGAVAKWRKRELALHQVASNNSFAPHFLRKDLKIGPYSSLRTWSSLKPRKLNETKLKRSLVLNCGASAKQRSQRLVGLYSGESDEHDENFLSALGFGAIETHRNLESDLVWTALRNFSEPTILSFAGATALPEFDPIRRDAEAHDALFGFDLDSAAESLLSKAHQMISVSTDEAEDSLVIEDGVGRYRGPALTDSMLSSLRKKVRNRKAKASPNLGSPGWAHGALMFAADETTGRSVEVWRRSIQLESTHHSFEEGLADLLARTNEYLVESGRPEVGERDKFFLCTTLLSVVERAQAVLTDRTNALRENIFYPDLIFGWHPLATLCEFLTRPMERGFWLRFDANSQFDFAIVEGPRKKGASGD